MARRSRCSSAIALIALCSLGLAPADSPKPAPDLSGYKTVETAATTPIAKTGAPAAGGGGNTADSSPAYLGVLAAPTDDRHVLAVADVDAESPASKAGILPGDVIKAIDGHAVKDDDGLLEVLKGKDAGESVEIELARKDATIKVRATLTPWSRPITARARFRSGLGVRVAPVKESEGVTIEEVAPGSLGEKSKLKVGEVLLKLDDIAVTGPDQLYDLIEAKAPGSTVVATLKLAEKAVDLKIKLDAPATPGGGPFGGGGFGGGPGGGGGGGGGRGLGGGYWLKPNFKLAIVCLEYPDVKHNDKITNEAWSEALFSEGTYTKTNVTGQPVFGSFRDYFLEQSCGFFKADGKVFPWLEVSKKRDEYATGNRMALLNEGLDKLLERDGKEALKDFDGIFFVYAGGRHPGPRGSLYWPHRASVRHGGKNWPYFIVEEGGQRMQGIAVLTHEFGHMLGMPDLYARPENPGMEGLGSWCNMSQQPNRMMPEHFGPWVKEKLGWLKPVVIDPTVKQKLALAPIENSPNECFKVLIRADGSEYYLLENRKKVGFDKSLPSEGLLIWHVLGNRPTLKESHGIEGPSGPRVLLNEVPYPSGANDAFTPYTSPSSRSPLGGGMPVSITNIKRQADGRVTFEIGYEYQ